jgi:hypothetical protein
MQPLALSMFHDIMAENPAEFVQKAISIEKDLMQFVLEYLNRLIVGFHGSLDLSNTAPNVCASSSHNLLSVGCLSVCSRKFCLCCGKTVSFNFERVELA